MTDLLLDQFRRLVGGLSADPWPELAASGFLDMVRASADGGVGLGLDDLFPLALETGGSLVTTPIVETMLARVTGPDATNIADVERALSPHAAARPLAAALAAAQMAGAMVAIRSMTIDYAQTRRQFGRPIGKFQAIQHQIAVLAAETEAAKMAAAMAMVGAPLEISAHKAAAAKIRAGEAARRVSAIAHAVHGAIGISQEHPLHQFTRKLRQWQSAHGGEGWWSGQLGRWVLAQRDDAVSMACLF